MCVRVIAIVCFTLAASAQGQADTSAIPRELATALVSTTDYSSSRARIVVGTFPTPEMSRLVPRGGRVLGGLVYEDRRGNANRFTGLLAYAESPDSVATLLEQQVTRAGLTPPSMEGMYGSMGGFVPAGFGGVGRERPLMFCGDSTYVTAMINEHATGSLVRLTTMGSTRNSICDARNAQVRVTGMISSERIVLPTLRPPTGASGSPDGSSGGMSRRGSSASYNARQSIAEMIDHFAAQLAEQGWTLGKRVISDDAGLLTARRVEKGETQILLLTDVISAPRQHELDVSVSVPSRRP